MSDDFFTMVDNKQLKGAIQAASYNILLQVVFRLQTFILNAFILRYISKDVLGIINVRLFLLYSTVLFLSKEAFKNACLSNTHEHNWPKVINLLWLMLPTAGLCSLVFGYIWAYILEQPQDADLHHQYLWAVLLVAISCVIEMIGEPLYVVARIFLFNKVRVVIESLSLGVRSLILALTVYVQPQNAILGYAFGQILFSFVWVIGIYAFFAIYMTKHKEQNRLKTTAEKHDDEFPFRQLSDFLPRKIPNQLSFSLDQVALTWSFFKQGFLKQILTEGERYVMTLFDVISFADQGVFEVVNNLGSIAARFIFRPVEDSSYQFFAGMVKRSVSVENQDQVNISLVAQFLQHLLRLMTVVGLVAVTFGFPYSYLLLHIYGGNLLSSGIGPILLRWHCIYILLIAVNGVTECYLFATMSKDDVEKYNYLMVGYSATFLILSWYLTRTLGSVGFLLANCVNMLARIAYSCQYIRSWYANSEYKPLKGLIPDFTLIFVLVASFIITLSSESLLCCTTFILTLTHILIGCLCLLCVAGIIFIKEKTLIRFFFDIMKKKKVA